MQIESYEFGNFRLSPTERYLLHYGEPIALTPKALDTLLALVSRSGHLVTKEDLLKEVWHDAFVEEATIVQNISTLRKILNRDVPNNKFIETVPKCGYRFVAKVTRVNGERISFPSDGSYIGDSSANGDSSNGSHISAELVAAAEVPSSRALVSVNQVAATPQRFNRKRLAVYGALGLLTLVLVGVFVDRRLRHASSNPGPAPFEKMSLVRIKRAGNARNAAISPDGKYIAYVALEAGKESLRVMQVSSPNDSIIMPAATVHYLGLTFSPDGDYVLFVQYEQGKGEGILYRIPVIGGESRRVLRDIDSPVTFSPNGKQMAFIRGYLATHETVLMLANADGTNEQKLASRSFPAFFSGEGPSWSPDGSIIACAVRNPDPSGITETVVGVSPSNGAEKQLTPERWDTIGRLSWAKTGARIMLTATQSGGEHQLWQISYPAGSVRRITNDLTNYRGVSLTSDATALSTVTIEAQSKIWVASGPGYHATELHSTSNDGLEGITWTPDGQLVFTSSADLWMLDTKSGLKKALTQDERRDFAPTVSRDGRFLIFSAEEKGTPAKLWRTNLDGSNPKQLTFGNDDRFPSASIDGKWVYYSSFNHVEQEDSYYERLWKVSIDGGAISAVAAKTSSWPLVSPDGKSVAFRYQPVPDQPWKVRIISAATGEFIQDLAVAMPGRAFLQWAPDGRGLTYIVTREGVSNLWLIELNGGPPRQLTHFDSGEIFRYSWSQDGKRLALVRGIQNGEVVLIRDFGS